jgi:antitoxin StbD
MNTLLSHFTASVSELKKNPSQLLKDSEGEPIAILNHNKPTAYLISVESYESIMEMLEDIKLSKIIEERKSEKTKAVEVFIDEL